MNIPSLGRSLAFVGALAATACDTSESTDNANVVAGISINGCPEKDQDSTHIIVEVNQGAMTTIKITPQAGGETSHTISGPQTVDVDITCATAKFSSEKQGELGLNGARIPFGGSEGDATIEN